MLDRYTKGVLTVIAVSLAALAVHSWATVMPTARAQENTPAKRCVWTSVVESGKPSLGQNGEIKLGREFKLVSDGGFELKAAYGWGNQTIVLFERCNGR